MADFIEKQALSEELVLALIETGSEKASELGQPSSLAIVDESGVLKGFLRMDGAPLLSVQVAQDKAYTAAASGISTDRWFESIEDDPPMAVGAPPGIDRLIIFGGGYPIVLDGQVVAGLGVSGGHYTEDMEIAEAALAVVRSRDPEA